MNVIILTPDRVGSTLLQRLLTIYMLRREFNRPVINLHELTNGIEKYYNPVLQQYVLGKPKGTDYGYFQSLSEVIELLKSVDHYITSRTALYHIKSRQDPIDEQLKYYDYLNKNFYVISCRRDNIFEQALSWAIVPHSKLLNVYSVRSKVESFRNIYTNGINISKENLIANLNIYQEYLKWCDTYFNIQSYFYYDRDVNNIENYILNLDFMQGHKNNTWQDMFGQSYYDYNTCHRLLPNLAMQQPNQNLLTFETAHLTNFPVGQVFVNEQQYNFLAKNVDKYQSTYAQINDLVLNGYLVTGLPIKLQSFNEKRKIIQNFDECIQWYNVWCKANNIGQPYSLTDIEELAHKEEIELNRPISLENMVVVEGLEPPPDSV